MVQSGSNRRPWVEAASSAFAVASALPVTMNSLQIADLFEKVERLEPLESCPLTAELSSLRNASGETLLIVAARANNVAAVKTLALDPDILDESDSEEWSALLNAAHKGHTEVVKILLESGANVDFPDSAHVNLIDEEDGLTPLIVAAGRGFTAVVERLLAADAQVNACDKFGSTALIWAARKGHLPIVQMLLNAGAEVDAVGMWSSTALMLATKGNYLSVVDLILTREPNVNVVDQNGLSALGIAAREGYADICESLINSGAFVNQSDKYGNWILISAVRSGNANIVRLLLEKFADVNARDSENRTALHLAIDKSFMDIVYLILERKPNLELKNKNYDIPSPVLIRTKIQLIGFVYYGSEIRGWSTPSQIANSLSCFLYRVRLLWNVATLYAPMHSENDIASNPVSFLFADYHRLSSIGGEQALAKIVATLFESAETHFGVLPVRLFCSLRTAYPTSMVLEEALATLSCALALQLLFLSKDYPIIIMVRYGYTNVPRRRVNAAARSVHKLRFEGLMQKLQSEVDILADMIRSLDAFTRSQTRLVVVVDGLDNCEQERMVQTLDALELLFSARKHRPFITIIAVDPHIIVSAINHNMHSALTGTELTGHDYLKNIVNMPLYLHNSALRQLQNKLKEKRESFADWKERYRRQDTFHGSHLSLSDGRQSRKATIVVGTRSIGESLLNDDYFSNMNPRAMRRIVNALTLTGRLMRAFEIDFSWLSLGHWVSLLEQWPSRMCWLIDRAVDINNNALTLAEVYHQLKDHIPKKDSLIELDRNPDNFEAFLDSPAIPTSEQLTVGHVKKFVPCTSNLDPYLRKLIRERRQGLEDPVKELGLGSIVIPPNAKYLFGDEKVWNTVNTPLVEMKLDAVCNLVKRLDIAPNRLDTIIRKFQQLNLGGLVLASCSLQDLKDALGVPLGDWTMIRLLVETLKAFGSNVPGLKIDKRKALTLPEEDEDGADVEVEVTRRDTIVHSPSALLTTEQRRRSMAASTEMNSDHKWLMESLSGMDLTQAEGDLDLAPSSANSVRFGDALEDGLSHLMRTAQSPASEVERIYWIQVLF
ncbi:putative septum site-determining protein MinC [Ostertagia ostertagi]